ncbi:MAG: ACT domain-containing protein [Bradymonadaceae bacterium]|nr:ACT domain-containing protein [Lujinxingiaceae bacterium]
MSLDHLVAPDDVKHITEQFVALRETLAERARAGECSLTIGRELSRATDLWLLALWEQTADKDLRELCALYALGGYGRRELCFGSDIDLVIEVQDDAVCADPAMYAGVERLMAWSRDARVKLSHAVRTPAQAREAFELDARTAISLIDARPLEPTRTLAWQSVDADEAIAFLRRDDQGTSFTHELIEAHRERLRRHGQTVYLLEPDLKNGEGGLRDLNCIHWAARVRWQFSPLDGPRPELDWNEEHHALYHDGLRCLLSLRNLLHLTRGRKHDRLNFIDQETLALHLATLYPEDYPADPVAATEKLMRDHYRRARAISRASERFLRRWEAVDREVDRDVGTCFRYLDGQLALRADCDVLDDAQILEALDQASREDILLDPALELYIDAHVQNWGEAQRADATLNTRFCALLTDQHTSERTSQRLLELGILTRLVPEFEPIVCHVQHDVYHVYTTDVHSLKCLEMARQLLGPPTDPLAQRWPAFDEIAHAIDDAPVFLLAALFHDIGKNRGGQHAQKGAAMMTAIGARLGLDRRRTDQLAFLVREHLTLSHTARRRDVSDKRVIRDIASRLRTVEALNQLTALTFCDMSTVGPDVMSDWNATLLNDLYRRLRAALEHGVESMWKDRQERVDEQRDALHYAWLDASNAALPGDPANNDAKIVSRVDEFVRDIPSDHVIATAPDALLRQFHVYDRGSAVGGSAFLCTPILEHGVTEVIVSTDDVPGTLAKIAGVLSSAGLNILTANIVTTSSGRTLDIFLVHQANTSAALLPSASLTALTSPRRIAQLDDRLKKVLDDQLDVEELLQRRIREARLAPRPTPSVETSVTIHQDLSDAFTVLEIKAPDQIGLLYKITRTLWKSGINTHVSKIDSLGTQVIDTFYLEDVTGGKLTPEKADLLIDALYGVLKAD